MADTRFFRRAGPFALKQLAEIGKAQLADGSDPAKELADVAPLETAGPSDLSFLDNPRYLGVFENSRAGACIANPRHVTNAPGTMALLLTDTPYRAYARIARAFYPPVEAAEGIHETAVVDASAKIGPEASLGPYVVVGPGAEIGAGCRLSAHVVVEAGVVIGDHTTIGPGASLSHCLVGKRCLLHAGVRIGNRGFGFARTPEANLDVPQLGRVLIEDDVEIGANATIDRGSGPDTVIGARSKIDNLVQIGHNVHLGEGCVLVAQSGVAGSSRLEDHVVLAAQAGIAGHLTIGRSAQIAAKSGVMRDVPAGQTVCGTPSIPIRDFFRLVSTWQRQLKAQGQRHE